MPAAYTDTTVSLEGTWVYTIAAIDAAGNEGPQSAPVSILYDRTPPPPPSGLSLPAVTSVPPTLTWIAGGPDALSGFAYFQILRDGNAVGSTTSPTFTDSGLTANGSHTYAVRSVDAAGNASAATAVQRSIFDNTAPDVPTNVAAAEPDQPAAAGLDCVL